ncbi:MULTISPECIES: biotin/lipoyl-containing protein [unclassified Mesorhizobium]|uniref:acetyl-CoA carboxylase biotin carboxyl carrier protein n=1 Tax=unclassified Mesorhizobium TaxID=325217 RepID=UPI00112BE4B2|nr:MULTISPECIES: biotin/lipoyl-containing protein [unclassified Mesorhizobium]TPL01017.1 acetyl-CoA carboxylase biotin carboxyl carrier protein subunit [Mesorhizobium sp. B2-4-16]TPL78037.1 acetyl-CoA carboxylase biotin carboxyl carrier protein subunit [Mesorhizobium sp. B2-4-3]
MDLNLVRELIDLVSRSPIGELQIERDGFRVRIAKQAPPPGSLPQPAPVFGAPAASGASPAAATIPRHSIRAPLTGVFYRSAGEGEPPLVSVGDVVEEGQKIGVLEAMKTFNVVEADRAGRIVEVAFEDHAAVQSGDVLFVLEEAG